MNPLVVGQRYDNNFCIWFMNPDYRRFLRDKSIVIRDFELYDKVVNASSLDDCAIVDSNLSRIAVETGSSEFESHLFVHSAMELVQNSAMHNYEMGSGLIHVHARFTPRYNLASVVSGGKPASFDRVKRAFDSSLSYFETLRLVNDKILPPAELMKLALGKREKGMKDIIGRSDYFGFTLDEGTHYQMIVSLKGTRQTPQNFIN